MPLQKDAFTIILCQGLNGDVWLARGVDRISAELCYQKAILEEGISPPLIRFNIQLKVDQHPRYMLGMSNCVH